MIRLVYMILLFLVVGCQSVIEGEVVADEKSSTDVSLIDTISTADLLAAEAVFEGLLSKVVEERIISSADTASMNLVRRFFPNTSRFNHHLVSIEPLAARDSFWLLLYEFITEEEEQNQMFLGSFSKTGDVIDLLKIQSISFDGHLSLNLLKEDVLEIEYRDFVIRPNLPVVHSGIDDLVPHVVTVRSAPQRRFVSNNQKEETAGTKYYHIQANGNFVALATSNRKEIERVFPQVSSRILSEEELERLQPDELELMRNEMYASHGYVFEDELLMLYFIEKGWYQPDGNFCEERLNEIEQINLNRMLRLDGILKEN